MKRLLIAAIASGTVLSAMPASAAVILSENFDAGVGAFTIESTTIAISTAQPDYVDCCTATGSPAALNNPFVVFGGGNVTNRGSLFTEINTVAGAIYTLSFRAGAFGSGTTNLSYSFGGIGAALALTANNNVDTTFNTYSYDFVGTGNVATLAFSSRGAGTNIDPVLDDVLLTAVPEPATWALMLVGFGGMGYAMRRNRKAAVSFS